MTDKLWFRKSDGALVRPTMDKPIRLEDEMDLGWAERSSDWDEHLTSLPALTDIVVDPEYAATLSDGWVKVERVRYEQECFDKWEKITKEDFYNTPYNRRIVILAPVEKGEDEDEAEEDKRILDAAKTDAHIRDWFDKWSERTKRNGGVLITTSIRELLTDFYNDHKPQPPKQ